MTSPISYFVAVVSTTAAVLSAGFTDVSALAAAVESFVSVVADPEPHAANVKETATANKNVYFFIYCKYTKNMPNNKIQ